MPTIDYFKNASNYTKYTAGTVIFGENEFGEVMYAVKEGAVDIIHNGVLLETVKAGHFFGEMAIIDTATRSAKAIARTDCKIVVITRDNFLTLVQQTPTFAISVMHEMAQRIRHMNTMLDD